MHEVEAAAVDTLGAVFRPRHRVTRPPGSPCANCGAILQGDWCHDCGQLAEDFHRSVVRLIMEAVEGLTHLDGRFWRTAPGLLIKPAKLTRDYIDGHRAAQIPPLRLFLVVLLLVFLTASFGAHRKALIFDSPAERSHVEASLQKMNFSMRWGNKTLSDPANWFKPRMLEVVRDPERFKLILESQEERFAFLALPLATLLLCGVFVFQRRFYVFDHTIFALHSLSFQGLLLTTTNLLGLGLGGSSGLLLFLAPAHLFVHMRGFYRTSILGTLLRMVLLAIGSLAGFVVLFLGLLLVGLNAMTPGLTRAAGRVLARGSAGLFVRLGGGGAAVQALQAIAEAVDRREPQAMLRPKTQAPADLRDVRVERAAHHVRAVPPHRLHDVAARERPLQVAEQQQGQGELLGRQHHRLAAHGHRAGLHVEAVLAIDLDALARLAAVGPPQHRLDPSLQHIVLDRLGDVVVGALR